MEKLFLKKEGIVQSVSVQSGITIIEIIRAQDENNIIHLKADAKSLMLTATGEKIGVTAIPVRTKVIAYIDSRKPIMMIHPPQFYPDLFIIEQGTTPGNVAVGYFDDNLYCKALNLRLLLTEETKLETVNGGKVKTEALKNKQLFIFYDKMTRGIPAQATPSKVLVYVEPLGNLEKS